MTSQTAAKLVRGIIPIVAAAIEALIAVANALEGDADQPPVARPDSMDVETFGADPVPDDMPLSPV